MSWKSGIPKKGMYRKGDDAVLGWSTSATTSPAKHATRASHAGALPVDLHSAQLRRRPVASLPSMGLEEACKRIGECLSQAKTRALSEEKQGLLWQDKRISIGTRFSGIGSVEEALHILQKHVPAKFQYRYACDHDEDSWNFHRSRFPPGQNFHFFKDVMGFGQHWSGSFEADFCSQTEGSWRTQYQKQARCLCHKKECTIPNVQMDISGSVCKDYSSQGQQRGVEGTYALSMLVRNAELRRRKVPLRVSENVVSPEGQKAIASSMSDCDIRYIITMCEDGSCQCLVWLKCQSNIKLLLCYFFFRGHAVWMSRL